MQCRLPRKNVPSKKSGLTWYFNETISWNAAKTYAVKFACDGVSYVQMRFTFTRNRNAKSYLQYIRAMDTQRIETGYMIVSPQKPFTWSDEIYRTITFDTPPTGDLLVWLKANAVPQ